MDDVRSPRMPDRVRRRIRVKHYSLHTEQAYVDRIRRFVLRHGKRPPPSLARGHVEASSLLPGGRPLGRRFDAEPGEARAAVPRSRGAGHRAHAARRAGRAKASVRPPAVPTHDEVARVLVRMRGTHRLPGRFPHGTGMRIMEGVLMRVKNIEFARRKILVRDGNGARDRVTMPPAELVSPLRSHPDDVRARRLHWRGNACFLRTSILGSLRSPASLTRTPAVCTHVLDRGGRGVVSPLDRL